MATLQETFSNTSWIGTKIEFYESSTNVSNNSSAVHVKFYVVSINGGYTTATTTGGTATITVGNETKYITVPNFTIAKEEVWLVGELDFTVLHETDGSKIISVSSYLNTGLGSSSLNGSLQLTTIPRASSVGCSDFYIESSTNIIINSVSSNFRHTLKYSFGSLSGIIVEKTLQTVYVWAPNASQLYAQIPNDIQGIGTIICETYNNDTLVGTKTCSFTARVDPNKNKPNVSLTVVDTNEATKALTGSENTLVKYFSNAKATITASAKNHATIKSYFINNVSSEQVSTINSVETNKFIAKVIDSRDIDNGSSEVITDFIEYVRLAIKLLEIERIGPTSDQVRMNLEGFYFNDTFGQVSNTLEVKIKYKQQYGEWSEYKNITPNIIEDNTFNLVECNLNALFDNASFDYQKAYTFEIVVNDKLMTINQETTMKRGLPVVAYGEDFMHVYGDLEVDGNIYKVDTVGTLIPGVLDNDDRLQQDIAIAYPTSNKTINAEYVTLPFTNAEIIGNKLIFKNGRIYIGKNVKKIKISAIAFLENMNASQIGYIWLFVSHNGTRICSAIISGTPQYFQSVAITDAIADVKENDYFELVFNNSNYTTHAPTVRGGKNVTRLFIEVLE